MKLWFYFDKAFPDILPLLNVVLEPAEDVGKKEKPQDGEHDEQLDQDHGPERLLIKDRKSGGNPKQNPLQIGGLLYICPVIPSPQL